MNKLSDTKPINLNAQDKKPTANLASDKKPTNQLAQYPTFVYLETRIINQGQPLPWGVNWALTYPTTFSFIGVRL